MSATVDDELRRLRARIGELERDLADAEDNEARSVNISANDEAYGRLRAIADVLTTLDDLDRGIIDLAELRRRIEALRA